MSHGKSNKSCCIMTCLSDTLGKISPWVKDKYNIVKRELIRTWFSQLCVLSIIGCLPMLLVIYFDGEAESLKYAKTVNPSLTLLLYSLILFAIYGIVGCICYKFFHKCFGYKYHNFCQIVIKTGQGFIGILQAFVGSGIVLFFLAACDVSCMGEFLTLCIFLAFMIVAVADILIIGSVSNIIEKAIKKQI